MCLRVRLRLWTKSLTWVPWTCQESLINWRRDATPWLLWQSSLPCRSGWGVPGRAQEAWRNHQEEQKAEAIEEAWRARPNPWLHRKWAWSRCRRQRGHKLVLDAMPTVQALELLSELNRWGGCHKVGRCVDAYTRWLWLHSERKPNLQPSYQRNSQESDCLAQAEMRGSKAGRCKQLDHRWDWRYRAETLRLLRLNRA